MISALLKAQLHFGVLVPTLLAEVGRTGEYGYTWGESWRPDVAVEYYALKGLGSRKSVHPLRLAIDLQLFRLTHDGDGLIVKADWLTKTEDHAAFGAFWKSLDAACRWGGDFASRPDGNHYSYAWEGRA